MQNLKKNLLVVAKMICGIWLIFKRALESPKFCTLMGYLCPKCIKNELKNYIEGEMLCYRGVSCVMSCVMTLNSDGKFEEKTTCRCKNDMRNLANFYASTQKSRN